MRYSMNMKAVTTVIGAVICALWPSFAYAAPLITISSSDGGTFVLQGTGMDGVATLGINVRYDTATLANPQVTQGALVSGAMMLPNMNVPGLLTLGIVRETAFSGSGTIASIAFTRTGSSPGRILSLSATLSNIDGKPIPAVAQVINPTVLAASDSSSEKKETTSQNTTSPTSSESTTQQTVSPGLVVVTVGSGAVEKKEPMTSSSPADGEQKAQGTEPEQATDTLARADAPALMKAPEKKYLSHKSVLDRFREYQGTRTVKALTALFEQDGKAPFRQDPAVLLADGAATVKVYFSLDVAAGGTPELAMISGTLLSLKSDGEKPDSWVAEIRPAKGESAAQLIVAGSDTALEIPLALAPKMNVDLDKSAKVTAADFSLFLKKRGTQKAPAFDLNGDGRRDYIDDYLFTANYLAAVGKQPVQKKKN